MLQRKFLLGLLFLLGASAVACATPASSDEEGSGSALSGSLSDARFCQVRDAYLAAQPADFTNHSDLMELSEGARASLSESAGSFQSLASFVVADVGLVIVADQVSEADARTTLTFLTTDGKVLGYAYPSAGSMSFVKSIRTGQTTVGVPESNGRCSTAQPAGTGPRVVSDAETSDETASSATPTPGR